MNIHEIDQLPKVHDDLSDQVVIHGEVCNGEYYYGSIHGTFACALLTNRNNWSGEQRNMHCDAIDCEVRRLGDRLDKRRALAIAIQFESTYSTTHSKAKPQPDEPALFYRRQSGTHAFNTASQYEELIRHFSK